MGTRRRRACWPSASSRARPGWWTPSGASACASRPSATRAPWRTWARRGPTEITHRRVQRSGRWARGWPPRASRPRWPPWSWASRGVATWVAGRSTPSSSSARTPSPWWRPGTSPALPRPRPLTPRLRGAACTVVCWGRSTSTPRSRAPGPPGPGRPSTGPIFGATRSSTRASLPAACCPTSHASSPHSPGTRGPRASSPATTCAPRGTAASSSPWRTSPATWTAPWRPSCAPPPSTSHSSSTTPPPAWPPRASRGPASR
mmetsp:Transcript_20894/g.70144  ORF Transcript_20894/g.70144 Transcript_20894/m.70144 type:complete len:260 (+) Transcript_20894:406-1185(+)